MTYSTSGCTAIAVLDTSVHGVVVQTSRSAPTRREFASSGTSVIRNRTVTDGSATSRYTSGWPISWSESGVPHRGQYGLIRKSRTSRPLSKMLFSAHQTDST